jgi:asparagine synthase (glutamine-hydrolysing)
MLTPRRVSTATRFEDAAKARYNEGHGTDLQQCLASDFADSLCNDMLVKVDRASMSCGLEARVPFLDHRVAEFGVGLPPAFTLGPRSSGFIGKRVLKALHERRFGPALAHRTKHGFSVPLQRWLSGPFDGACERLFAKKRLDHFGILSSDALSNGGFRRWLLGSAPEVIWHAFALAAWCEATVGEGPDALRELIDDPPRSQLVPAATEPARALGVSN